MMTFVRVVICGVLAANLATAHDYGGLDDPSNTNTTVDADPDPPRQDEPQVATCPPSIADDLSGFWRRQDKNDRGPDPLFTKIKVMSFVVGHVFFDEASFRGVGRLVPCTRKVIAVATHKEMNVQVMNAQGTLSDDGDAIHWRLADGKPLRTWRRVGSRAQRRKARREPKPLPAPEPVTEPSPQPVVSIDPNTQKIKVTWTDACPEEGVSTDEGCERFRVGVQNMYDKQRELDEKRLREREAEEAKRAALEEEERRLAERAAETSGDLDAELSEDPTEGRTEETPKDVVLEDAEQPESKNPVVDGDKVLEVGACVRILRGFGKGERGLVLRFDAEGDPVVDLGNGTERPKVRDSVEVLDKEACKFDEPTLL